MTLTAGARIGPYDILEAIGAGGMGEVYRARDTRLDRNVAIKILPELFATDPERLARFEREAKTLASLNHPNIAQIHGIEETATGRALVMELVEGEDLSARIARGPMPAADAVAVARQIAGALEAAHERGIVHRDLKPANVKLRDDGTVKVLDFGLAKALAPDGAGATADDVTHSPTITSPMTQMGVILGTAAYMAPEQAKGKAVDKRADIWAFGVVLFEMLAGVRAFKGDDVSDVIAAVLRQEIDWQALPAGTPAAVRRVLARCLERDPKARLRDIGEARIALDAMDGDRTEPDRAAPAPRSRARTLTWLGATLATAAATGLIVWQVRAPAEPPVRRFMIPVQGDALPVTAAIAPGGEAVAFIVEDRVWLQRLDEFTPAEVPSSAGAHAIFWSPDGAFLGFQARGQLWTVAAAGGQPNAIGRVPQDFTTAGGAAWIEDGRIIFTTGGTGLLEMSASGGTVSALLDVDPAADDDLHTVSALPGGRGLLYVAHPTGAADFRLELYVPSDRTRRVLHTSRSLGRPVYSPSGHILFEQGNGVWMLPFSVDRLAVTGEPVRVAPDARSPSVARDGTLVMVPGGFGGGDARVTFIDRAGKTTSTLGLPNAPVSHLRMSPDGRLIAATVGSAPESDIWIFDAVRGTERRLTFEAGADAFPSWTHDGRFVVYHCGTSICARRADGSGGRVELLAGALPISAPALSPDGRRLVFVRNSRPGDADLWVVELGPKGPAAPVTAEPRALITTDRVQRHPDISPDGRFVAYVSAEAGTFSVYVSTFPGGDGKWEVSRGFGAWPRWGAKDNRLYFIDEQQRIAELEVELATTFQPGAILARTPARAVSGWGFDVDGPGQRFVLPRPPAEQHARPGLLLVQHWKGR